MRKLVETANTNLDLTSKDYFLLAESTGGSFAFANQSLAGAT